MNYLIIVCQFSSAFRLLDIVFDIDSRLALIRVANPVSPVSFPSQFQFPTHNSPVPSSHYQTNVYPTNVTQLTIPVPTCDCVCLRKTIFYCFCLLLFCCTLVYLLCTGCVYITQQLVLFWLCSQNKS